MIELIKKFSKSVNFGACIGLNHAEVDGESGESIESGGNLHDQG